MTQQEQKNSTLRSAAVVTALAAASFGVAQRAEAVLMPNGSLDQNYLNYGATFQGQALAFKITVPGATNTRDTTATYWNSGYALTSAHNVADLLQYNPSYEVASGLNFRTDRGAVIPVASISIYPGYDGTRNTPDLAIIKFAVDAPIAAPNVIGTAVAGDVLSSAGYGFAFRPSDPIPAAQDGFLRGWDSRVLAQDPIDASPIYYRSTFFSIFDGVSLVGKGLGGDSGGPAFNNLGQLVGITTAQTGNASTVGATIYLNLSQPEVSNWIQNNTVIPEPSSLALLGLAGAGLASRSRR